MAKINLLPWRAERRERRKRDFFTQLIIAGVVAIVVVLLWGAFMSARISSQNGRNSYLKGQIKQLDAKISEIQNLKKVKNHLLSRKKIVEDLQSKRSQMVHLFDQVVKTIPSGARLTGLTEVEQGDNQTLTLDGVAQSNATVAEYMRNIQASPWMGPVQLIRTDNVHASSSKPYEFELVVKLGTPKQDANGAAPASGSSSAAAASTSIASATSSPFAPASATSAGAGSKPAVATSAKSAAAMAAANGVAKPTTMSHASAPVAHNATDDAPVASTAKGGAKS